MLLLHGTGVLTRMLLRSPQDPAAVEQSPRCLFQSCSGQATQVQATDKTSATATPGTVAPTSFVSEPEAPSVLPKEKVKKTSK
jgi:hypothetical protein